ncbi:MAG: CvpA family protein [Parvibaculum sp.]|nr:CvpA family protein [Parvibaculum sp.]
MTLFDLIVIGVLLVSSVLALLRGFTNEMLSIVAWVAGALAALWLFPYVAPFFSKFVASAWLAAVIAALVVFLAGYLLVAALTARWSGALMDIHDRASLMDRTLGFLFGLARGLLIVTVAYLFFVWLVPNPDDHPDWIRDAQFKPTVESTASLLFSLAPTTERAPVEPAPAARQPAPAPRSAPANSGADNADGPGYNPSERRGLDRLFENTTGE